MVSPDGAFDVLDVLDVLDVVLLVDVLDVVEVVEVDVLEVGAAVVGGGDGSGSTLSSKFPSNSN